MADRVTKVSYSYLTVPNRAGQGERVLQQLEQAGVNLLAYHGFPVTGGKAQLDLFAENPVALRRVARKQGWKLSAAKKGFMVQGDDRLGAVRRHIRRLADQKISVTAADALCAGKGRYGMILWVKPKDYTRAAKALRAR